MKVLVVGNGSREHAIAWKLHQSTRVDELFVAPGNAGTAFIASNITVSSSDIEGLAKTALRLGVDLTIVGPEGPLAAGIVDRFQRDGLPIFGPDREAARIESSKIFAKNLMVKYGIPTGKAEIFDSYEKARKYLRSQFFPLVVKADGLAAGKGVTVARNEGEAEEALYQCMEDRVFGPAGDRVLIEEWLTGPEVSVFAFTDGETVSPLVTACDYKRAYDGDDGPNTGGMGSYSPWEFWNEDVERDIREKIIVPTVRAMASEGYPYKGVLYGGLMLTEDGLRVLEFNCRLGDPETQVILPRLSSDLADVLLAVVEGTLSEIPIEWSNRACVGVVMAAGGYPGSYENGFPISGLSQAEERALVFYGGTRLLEEGNGIVTEGGRILTVVGTGSDLERARSQAYEGIESVFFEGGFYRRDIAAGVKIG